MNLRIGILIAACIALLAACIAFTGVDPGKAFGDLIQATLGNDRNLGRTLRETTPLLLAGLAVFVALKAGLFNIGVEGQLTMGALACGIVALAIPGPGGMVLGIVAGMAAGALWAFPAGWIKAYRGGHEVISTIMLNNIAAGISLALLAGPLKDPGQESTTMAEISPATQIPNLFTSGRFQFNWVTLIAALLIGAVGYWLKRHVRGYELRLTGENPRAAEFAGVDVKKVTVRAMSSSGALGGLTGSVLVLAYEHRFYQSISSGYGFDALGVALLSGSHPLGIVPAALLFGILNKGSSAIQILGIPKGITYIVLAALIIVFAALRYRRSTVYAN